MIYRIVFKMKDQLHTYGVGVYAATEELAKQVGVVLIYRAFNYRIDPSDPELKVIAITGMDSDVATTT